MGGVGNFFQRQINSVVRTAEDIARETNELVQRNKVLSAVATVINPTVLLGTYSATQSPISAIAVADELIQTAKEVPNLQWYYFANPYSLFAGAYQRRRENQRREANAFANRQAELLQSAIEEYKRATADLLAERATGELRLMNARLAATYVGNNTFVSDDKPAEWRILGQLYKMNIIDSDEWRRQRAYASYRPFGVEEIEDDFMSAARHYRAMY